MKLLCVTTDLKIHLAAAIKGLWPFCSINQQHHWMTVWKAMQKTLMTVMIVLSTRQREWSTQVPPPVVLIHNPHCPGAVTLFNINLLSLFVIGSLQISDPSLYSTQIGDEEIKHLWQEVLALEARKKGIMCQLNKYEERFPSNPIFSSAEYLSHKGSLLKIKKKGKTTTRLARHTKARYVLLLWFSDSSIPSLISSR